MRGLRKDFYLCSNRNITADRTLGHNLLEIMKRRLALCLLSLAFGLTLFAQTPAKYGYFSRKAILDAMPEMAIAQAQLADLRSKYEAEARYNETSFRRQFSEFLQSQKGLPEAILLKRQADLQTQMERSLAFRKEAEGLLKKAEADLFAPIHRRLDEAIRRVGMERGYECMVNTDAAAIPFLQPQLSEDASSFLKSQLDIPPTEGR